MGALKQPSSRTSTRFVLRTASPSSVVIRASIRRHVPGRRRWPKRGVSPIAISGVSFLPGPQLLRTSGWDRASSRCTQLSSRARVTSPTWWGATPTSASVFGSTEAASSGRRTSSPADIFLIEQPLSTGRVELTRPLSIEPDRAVASGEFGRADICLVLPYRKVLSGVIGKPVQDEKPRAPTDEPGRQQPE